MTSKKVVKVSDLRIPIDYSLSKSGITQSLLGSWQTCRRRFLFEVNGYYSPEKIKKTAYGTMVHEILDKLYTHCLTENDVRSNSLNAAKDELCFLIKDKIETYKFTKEISLEEAEIYKAKAQAVLENYVEFYIKDFTEFKIDAIEEVFGDEGNEVKFANIYLLRGKRDGRIRDKNGDFWNFEHKNYSRVGDDLLTTLQFDLQNLFYLLADSLQGRTNIKGVLYNIIRAPEVRKFKTPYDVYKYLSDEISKNPQHYFIRYEISYDINRLNDFGGQLLEKLIDLELGIKKARFNNSIDCFYHNEKACNMPYRCDFQQACASCTMAGYKQKTNLFEELK